MFLLLLIFFAAVVITAAAFMPDEGDGANAKEAFTLWGA
jgi:hypothetical protein